VARRGGTSVRGLIVGFVEEAEAGSRSTTQVAGWKFLVLSAIVTKTILYKYNIVFVIDSSVR
jgi:hypothetical protein